MELLNLDYIRMTYQNQYLVINPLIESDYGIYECLSNNSREQFNVQNVQGEQEKDPKVIKIIDDSVEISSRELSKYYLNGVIYWKKIVNDNDTAFMDFESVNTMLNDQNISNSEKLKEWENYFNLDPDRMSIKEGKLLIKFFNEKDFGLYECIFAYSAFNSTLIRYAYRTIYLTKADLKEIIIDKYMFLYGDWNHDDYEHLYESKIGHKIELDSILSSEINNGWVLWRKIPNNDTFYLNSFFENYIDINVNKYKKIIFFFDKN